MPARKKINKSIKNLKPQESKANEFKQRFNIDQFLDDKGYAEEMAPLIIHGLLRKGFHVIPVQPKQDDEDEIPFAAQIKRTKIGMARKHNEYADTNPIFDSIKHTIDVDGNNW